MSNVRHPAHYNIPGRKECIVEMLEKFGPEKVAAFCELNAYKYRYRHDLKGGEEDLQKADFYDRYREGLKTETADEKFRKLGYEKQLEGQYATPDGRNSVITFFDEDESSDEGPFVNIRRSGGYSVDMSFDEILACAQLIREMEAKADG